MRSTSHGRGAPHRTRGKSTHTVASHVRSGELGALLLYRALGLDIQGLFPVNIRVVVFYTTFEIRHKQALRLSLVLH